MYVTIFHQMQFKIIFWEFVTRITEENDLKIA